MMDVIEKDWNDCYDCLEENGFSEKDILTFARKYYLKYRTIELDNLAGKMTDELNSLRAISDKYLEAIYKEIN
jgi:hypothetical protein